MKPKHHYLLHYSDLILYFGLRIHLWILRFQSKHSYFKECTGKLNNFIHLCKTLAERHHLLQAYLCNGSIFPSTVQAVGEAREYDELYYGYSKVCKNSWLYKHCPLRYQQWSTKGQSTAEGLFFMNANEYVLVLQSLPVILISHTQVHFMVDMLQSVLLNDLGLHFLGNSEERFMCVQNDSLCDY